MKPTLLFISQDIATANHYAKLLESAPYKLIWAEKLPDTPNEPAPELVIFYNNIEELPTKPKKSFPKQHTPLLIISDTTTAPPVLQDTAALPYLTDFLAAPVPQETLLTKINFLLHVGKINMENQTCRREHGGFIDWFTSHDSLTGLFNRHQFGKVFPEKFNQSKQENRELCLLILDIDYFSELNRFYSNEFGDSVLNELAARLTQTTREEDICFRFTGGDIVVLMPDTDLATAQKIGEDIRSTCQAKAFISHEIEKEITISIGIASALYHNPSSGDEMFSMAETALYAAKANGRNRCETYSPLIQGEFITSKKNFETLQININKLLTKAKKSAISSLQFLAKDVAGEEHRIHVDRASQYALLLGEQLGLEKPMLETLHNAIIIQASIRTLIHRDIIAKPMPLNTIEKQILNELPNKISELMESFNYFSKERDILITGNEHFDGTGFPKGLQGEEIPLEARILNIIDSFAAMDTDRPFRTRKSPDYILKELENEAGKQFDPQLVLTLLDVISENQLLNIDKQQLENSRKNLITKFPEIANC